MRTYTFTLTDREVLTIATGLGKQPYEAVAPLLGKIQQMIERQEASEAKSTEAERAAIEEKIRDDAIAAFTAKANGHAEPAEIANAPQD